MRNFIILIMWLLWLLVTLCLGLTIVGLLAITDEDWMNISDKLINKFKE